MLCVLFSLTSKVPGCTAPVGMLLDQSPRCSSIAMTRHFCPMQAVEEMENDATAAAPEAEADGQPAAEVEADAAADSAAPAAADLPEGDAAEPPAEETNATAADAGSEHGSGDGAAPRETASPAEEEEPGEAAAAAEAPRTPSPEVEEPAHEEPVVTIFEVRLGTRSRDTVPPRLAVVAP